MMRCVALCLGLAVCLPVHAQTYPQKVVRIVTGGVGGGSDFTGRLLAQHLTTQLGQRVIVENRGGASGAIAVQTVTRAPADGHTLLYYSSSLWIIPLMQTVPWDTLRDFAPITLAASAPNILVVHPLLPAKSVRELVALARARPGELNYGSGVMGSSMHLAAELFQSTAGVKITQVNYKGAGPALADLITGQLQLVFASAGSVAGHVASGRLRALAVTSPRPSPLAPGLPTVAESGLPGFESAAMYALFAPAGTPAAIVSRVHAEATRAIRQPEVRERFITSGVEPAGNAPHELAATIKADVARYAKIIRNVGIRAD